MARDIKVPPWPEQGNPCWPLHPDHESLTDEGRRQDRVNACSLWQVEGLPKNQKAELTHASWSFFDNWYLWPDEEDDFDPLFYEDPPLPPPDGHRLMDLVWATDRFSVGVAPRGYAKSSKVRKVILPCMLTRPGYRQIYATSTAENAEFTGSIIKSQLTFNERILQDFSPEMRSGVIKPPRGEASFGVEFLEIGNGAWLQNLSVESRQRGKRPHVYWLDDPEYDPKEATSMETLRTYASRLIFKVVMPMVGRKGRSIRWIGTFVSRRHFLWHAMETVLDSEGRRRARNPRFEYWTRFFLDAIVERDGVEESCWPRMWPLREADIEADPTLEGHISLEAMERTMGRSVFLAEMRGRPGEGDEVFFPLLTEKSHGYTFREVDDALATDPMESKALIEWHDIQGTLKRERLGTFLQSCWRFITVDTSFTAREDSDYKAIVCMAATPENELFVLDCWQGQTPENVLIDKSFKMAERWRANLYPEAVKQSLALVQTMDSLSRQRAKEMLNVEWLPRVTALRVGVMAKEAKIAALQPRFQSGLIKFPLERLLDLHWSSLFDQVAGFNPEAQDGGLKNDDLIDCVSMSTLVLKGRSSRLDDAARPALSALDRMRRGEYTDETGVPLLALVPPDKLTSETVQELLAGPETTDEFPRDDRTVA